MNSEEIREYVLLKEDVTEGFPFGEGMLVFKVKSKMFLIIALDEMPTTANMKCEPDRAIELREQYPDFILPGYHMNKMHWNTVVVESIKSNLLKEMIDNSYELVNSKIPKKKK